MKVTTIKVDVSADDIKAGWRRHCQLCPIARAIKRADESVSEVDVTHVDASVVLADSEEVLHASMPMKARRFARDFDNAQRVKPISFQLNFR